MTKPAAALLALLLLAGCGQSPTAPRAVSAGGGALNARAASSAGVTPAMAAALGKLFDANGDGQISKNEGFVELMGPEEKSPTLISNYYDENYKHGDEVKPVAVKTLVDRLAQGYKLTIRGIKGDINTNGYDTVGMSRKELDKLIDGVSDILAQSPLAKGGLIGSGIPVRHVVTPHYILRKGTDKVERWSMSKSRSMMEKVMSDKAMGVTIHPAGTHAEGAFVLEVREYPVF